MPQKKRKQRRLGKSANSRHRRRAEFKDHVWAWDFVFDKTPGGAALKWLRIVDEHTRESLACGELFTRILDGSAVCDSTNPSLELLIRIWEEGLYDCDDYQELLSARQKSSLCWLAISKHF